MVFYQLLAAASLLVLVKLLLSLSFLVFEFFFLPEVLVNEKKSLLLVNKRSCTAGLCVGRFIYDKGGAIISGVIYALESLLQAKHLVANVIANLIVSCRPINSKFLSRSVF